MSLLGRIEKVQRSLIGPSLEPITVFIERGEPGGPAETDEALLCFKNRPAHAQFKRAPGETSPAFEARVTKASTQFLQGIQRLPKHK